MKSGGISLRKAGASMPHAEFASITGRFYLLARYPQLGRQREVLRPALRSYPAGNYVILYRIEGPDVLILHVFHGRRDIEALIGS
jgi:toxin ParE1/3/4